MIKTANVNGTLTIQKMRKPRTVMLFWTEFQSKKGVLKMDWETGVLAGDGIGLSRYSSAITQ